MLTRIVRVVCDLIFRALEGEEAVIWRPNLPTEIISNILLRLPTASLQRLRHVSKEWLEIITDTHFAELHLARQPLEFELIHSLLITEEPYRVSSFFLESQGLRYSQKRKIPKKAKVYCSFKGLILFEEEYALYVANPITGDTLRLPPFPGYICPVTNANIVCDSSSKECKVVIIHMLNCYILTLDRQGCSTWRKLELPCCHNIPQFYNPVFSGGSLHWITCDGIISMDLGQEKFLQEIRFPFGHICIADYKRRVSIGDNNTRYSVLDEGPLFLEWGGGLAIVPTYQWKPSYCIFILKDSRWSELEIDVTFFEHMSPSEKFGGTPPYPVASLRNGEVIIFKKLAESIVDDDCFFACHLQRREITPFKAMAPQGKSIYESNGYYRNGSIIPHVDSMVSFSASWRARNHPFCSGLRLLLNSETNACLE